ncbi:nuclease-related domain-containing DEAD/DEAH box helicase [Thalassomonas actiniarum]|uniref:NERD domain-containing protein/DEAD/DEAH box helicase n=1 Tax=Thalassomonas actiniarum TaxID=485447 RepID=A0AAF0C5D3_9GAMM|nr:NERD domain-containing protein [Thalassomonas actiniarum]WDE00735.1 NERD domain-containing protein/DEAD/DEAH box helicase [Thalassomonas actiniarum]
MKMNPIVVYKFESKAEKKLFPVFEQTDIEGATVFHSLNIPKHEKKQWAEADFVVVSNRGILILEVKGGRLSVEQGSWYTKDRDDNVKRLKESPVEQAKSARFALEKMLREKSLNIKFDKINFGFGVMFPDVKLGDVGIELTKDIVFDAIDWDRKKLRSWLMKLYKYWVGCTGKAEHLTSEEVAIICSALRTEFDREKSLLAEVGDSWQQMISLTEQQYLAVDMILANKQVVVEGAAGTGKTLVAIRACKVLDAQKENVLFVCQSPVLASFAGGWLTETEVQVVNFNSLKLKVSRGEKLDFSVLIVDEGQDILDVESIDILDSLFAEGLNSGRWYVFMDPNNQSSLYADYDASALEYLEESSFKAPLTRNCRNTLQIAQHTLMYTGGDIGKFPIRADGLPVIWKNLHFDSSEAQLALIEEQLTSWVDDESVSLGDITLLSPLNFEESVVNKLSKRWRRKIVIINDSYGERWLDTQLSFSSIRDFKGLENRYVMLIDLDALLARTHSTNQLYVAMTRANSVLWMATPMKHQAWFDERRLENEQAYVDYLHKNRNG